MSQVHGLDYANTVQLSFRMVSKLREVIKKYNIDLVHAYWVIPSGFLASFSCGKIPLVITLPGSDIKVFGKRRIFKPPITYALRKAAKVITVSTDLKRESSSLGADERKISVIPAGVDAHVFRPMDKESVRSQLGLRGGFLMLFAGSLFRIKRVDRLIDVCARLGRGSDIHLVIAGNGPERENLENMAKGRHLSNVEFRGAIPYWDMPFHIAAADALVLASESEGLPRCVQEAMASGVPVVANNVGGLREIIIDGVNGYLTSSEAEMEGRLRILMASPKLAETLGSNAREFAQQHLSLDTVVKNIQGVYSSVVGETI